MDGCCGQRDENGATGKNDGEQDDGKQPSMTIAGNPDGPRKSVLIIIIIIYTKILLKSVSVHTLKVAILARSSREMSLTVRIV